jgi:hypothetical protein
MKLKPLLGLLFTAAFMTNYQSIKAQNISLGYEAGSGGSYIFENAQDKYLEFSPSFSMGANLKYTPKDAYFGLKLSLLYVSSRYKSNYPYWNQSKTGEITTITTSILLEHIKMDKKWNWGYNIGMGVTREDYFTQRLQTASNSVRNYMSVSMSGIGAYKLGDNSNLTLSPMLLWTDPINTFRVNDWQNGREDLSALIQLGYVYNFN